MKYFVTGTDTDVGKTTVCAWLALHLKAAYWKPIQCGYSESGESDREIVQRLSRQTTHPERYRFALPRSPHVAAAAAGQSIDVDSLHLPPAERLLVEGAGGVLVPLNDKQLMIDLIVALGLPAIIVARGTLGGINHLLLTIAALRQRQHSIAGVVFTGTLLPETLAAARDYGATPVLGHLPQLARVDSPALSAIPVPELVR